MKIEEAKETGRLTSKLKLKPAITKAVKLAESQAKEQGEVLTDLMRTKAALPGLTETVGKLRDLSAIATSTLGGRVFDMAAKVNLSMLFFHRVI